MTIYTHSNTKSRKLRQGGGRRKHTAALAEETNFSTLQTFCVAGKKRVLSFVQIPEVTPENGQLMTHNHKMVIHKRTIYVYDSVNTSKGRTEILNQCLKAFTLFMHNLTPTTALDVRCIFGEDKQAGGWKCWIQALSVRWWRKRGEGGGSLSGWGPTVDKTRREETRDSAASQAGGFFFNQLNMRNLILHANSQFVFFCCFCTLRVLYGQIKTDQAASKWRHM